LEAGWEVVGRRLLPRELGTAGGDAVGGGWAVKLHAVATAGCVALGGVLFSLLSGGVHCRVDLQPLAVKSLREGGVAGRWLAVPGAAG